jgi:hypothetical protein
VSSRRLSQQRKKLHAKTKHASQEESILESRLQHTNLLCQKAYGFNANPNLSLQKNFRAAVSATISLHFKQPKNLTFHNLCRDNQLPVGSKKLLGLNLKF